LKIAQGVELVAQMAQMAKISVFHVPYHRKTASRKKRFCTGMKKSDLRNRLGG
jgi:hypothetical protein